SLHTRDIATYFFQLRGVTELLGGDLHAQTELGLEQLVQLLLQRFLVFAAEFRCFHIQLLLLADLANHESGSQWQFGSGQAERCARQFFCDAVHLVQDFAWLDFSDVVLWVTLTVTHTDFGRLVRNRLVREDTDPDTTATLDVTGHGTTCRFD